MVEMWKDVIGYEGFYWVSDLGGIKSRYRILGSSLNSKGYVRVKLCRGGTKTSKLVHRLVAEAFIPNPENKPQINHKDGNKRNNQITNLEWVTSKENIQHQFSTGLNMVGTGENCGSYKGQVEVIDPKTNRIVMILKGNKEMRQQGFDPAHISQVLLGKQKSHKGFTFRRQDLK